MLKSLAVIAACSSLSWCAADAAAAEPGSSVDPGYLASRFHQERPDDKKPAGAAVSFEQNTTLCIICHSTGDAGQLRDKYRADGVFDRVTMLEAASWQGRDFHSQATAALATERAKSMGTLLGYDVKTDARCLNCHSGHQQITSVASATSSPTLEFPVLSDEGVSCQACHGPAANWTTKHQDKNWWKTPDDAKYELGLLNVRHPVTRSQICFSCHIGSSREGKVLTHEMYAAGHPPLPNFEVESAVTAMPYHGLLFEDKIKKTPDVYKSWHKTGDFYRTRSVLTAGIVALRMQVQLLIDETSWSKQPAAAKGAHQAQWPELAYFNCASCHHELDSDRRRQYHAQFATPGRPILRKWPTALYDVAKQGSDASTKSEPILGELNAAFDRSPFGRVDEVHAAAEKVAAKLDAELAALENQAIDAAKASNYLAAIQTIAQGEPLDYDEARQLMLAAEVIVKEIKASGAVPPEAAARLGQFEKAFAEFDESLQLKLPTKPLLTAATATKDSYVADLLRAGSDSLQAEAKFDEFAFRRRMKELFAVETPGAKQGAE